MGDGMRITIMLPLTQAQVGLLRRIIDIALPTVAPEDMMGVVDLRQRLQNFEPLMGAKNVY